MNDINKIEKILVSVLAAMGFYVAGFTLGMAIKVILEVL